MSGRLRRGFGLVADLGPGTAAPGLAAAPAGTAPTVTVTRADGPVPELPAGSVRVRQHGADGQETLWVDRHPDGTYQLQSFAHGAFVVAPGGATVVCHPAADRPNWAELITMQALPLAATLQGREVFHASAVVIGGAAVMFTAASGTGKTSLAAHLAGQGAALLTDDVVAIAPDLTTPTALAGAHHLRLWPDEAARVLARYPGRFTELGRGPHKVLVDAGAPPQAAPLRALCVLERVAAGAGPVLEPLAPVAPTLLLGATFNASVREPERQLRQLDVCAALAQRLDVVRVRISPEMDAAALAAHLLGAFAGPGAVAG